MGKDIAKIVAQIERDLKTAGQYPARKLMQAERLQQAEARARYLADCEIRAERRRERWLAGW